MAMTDRELSRAFFITRVAFVFGAGSTMLINLAHAESGWGPKLASLIAPISILFVVEMLVHIPNPQHRGFTFLLRFSTLLIGAAALTISYTHTAELLMEYGESPLMAWITPIVPDGMMVVSSIGIALVMREREARLDRRQRQEEAERQRQQRIEEQEQRRVEEERQAARLAREEEARRHEQEHPTEHLESAGTPAISASQETEVIDVEVADQTRTEEVAPVRTRRSRDTEKLRTEARELFRKSTLTGYPLSAEDLASKFGKGPSWGSERIREVRSPREEDQQTVFPEHQPA